MSRQVVISGASSGIGLACVHAFLRQGDHVTALSGPRTELDSLVQSPRLVACKIDVRDAGAVSKAIGKGPEIDVLVLSAGRCDPLSLEHPEALHNFRSMLEVNLMGAFHCLHAAVPRLRGGSSVVAVSSGLGKFGRREYAGYSASKHGLLGLIRSAALELAPRGIRVNAVCPGWADTPMAREDVRRAATKEGLLPQDKRKQIEAAIPLGRFVRAEEVAELIAWLSSPSASAITGQAYNIACGEFTH